METSPTVIEKKKQRIASVFLLIIGVVFFLRVTDHFYNQTPHFSGSVASSINITMRSPISPTDEPKILVRASITDGSICAALFALMSSARFHTDHKCSDIGSLIIQYTNGKTDTLALLPGHDPTSYEFRFGNQLFSLPRDQFYHVLQDANVDTTMIPESEH